MPLLNCLKMSAQVAPSKARRLATMFRIHSSTQPWGCTYFHRAGFLLPMVVSRVTCERQGGPQMPCDSAALSWLRSQCWFFPYSSNLLWCTPLMDSLEKYLVQDSGSCSQL